MSLRVDINLDRICVNDTDFTEPAVPAVWCEVLGEPSRIIAAGPPAPWGHRNNQIHAYDSEGLYLNEHHYTYLVSAVTFVLWPEEAHFDLEAPFTGELDLAGRCISSGISEEELLDCAVPFESALRGSWHARGSRLYIAFNSIGRKGRSRRRSKKRCVRDLSVCFKHDPWHRRFRPPENS
jgi:hypothetical protein